MCGLLVIERCAAAEITGFDQGDAQTTACGFVGAGESLNAAADNEHVVDVAVESRQVTRSHRGYTRFIL